MDYKKLLTRNIIEEDFVSPNLFLEEEPLVLIPSGPITLSSKANTDVYSLKSTPDYFDLTNSLTSVPTPKPKTKKKKKTQLPKPVTWKQVSSPTKAHLYKVQGSSQGLFFCGDQETILLKRPKYPIRLWNKGENDSNQLFDFWVGKDSIFPEVFLHIDGRIIHPDGNFSKTSFDYPIGICGSDQDHLFVLEKDGTLCHGRADQEPEEWIRTNLNSRIPDNAFVGVKKILPTGMCWENNKLTIFSNKFTYLVYDYLIDSIVDYRLPKTNNNIFSKWSNGTIEVMVGEKGTIIHRTNNDDWKYFASSKNYDPKLYDSNGIHYQKINFYSVWGTKKDNEYHVYMIGSNRNIRRLVFDENNKIKAFCTEKSPTDKGLVSIWGTGPNDIWACGEDGTIIHYGNE